MEPSKKSELVRLLTALTACLGFMSVIAITGCEDKNSAEEVGEKIDEAADDAADAVEDAADDAADAVDEIDG